MAKKTKSTSEYMFSSMGASYSMTDSQEIVKRGSDYIWYGLDNLFPQHTIRLYQNSATQNALVNSISAWIYGGGIDADNKEQHPEEWLQFNKLINHKIGKNDIQLMCMDLKLHGGFYISVTYSVDRTQIVEMEVLPYETMRSGHVDEDGQVDTYYHSHDWNLGSRAKYTELRAFNPHEKATYPNQVLCVKMNSVGSYYYPKPDWIGAWNYVELDVNVAQFHLSQIENGLAPSFIINFANGIPAREKREDIKRTIEAELSGSRNAGKFLCTFSDGRDTTPDIQAVPLSDADKQFQFLSTEITNKIMVGNRVVSPRLFGVNIDGGGFGNNAEELQTASALFEQTVVNPFRDVIIDALKLLMAESGINLQLFFEPFDLFKTEFSDTEAETINEEVAVDVIPNADATISDEVGGMVDEAETEKVDASYNGAQISSAIDIVAKVQEGILTPEQAVVFLVQFLQLPLKVAQGFFSGSGEQLLETMSSKKKDERPHLSDEQAEFFLSKLEHLAEKSNDDEWQLLTEDKINSKEELHKFANKMPTESMADADGKSSLDVGLYKVRYAYQKTSNTPNKPGNKSRKFCDQMMQWSRQGLEWRLEDINEMTDDGVNGAFSEKGQSKYSIFAYKGGCYCRHGWLRRIYFRKTNPDGTFMPNEGLTNERRVGNNPFIKQKGTESIAPYDMPNNGKVNPPFMKN
tara:strand:- start:3071 stop:5140 length:2070 start_codon:yes stop_codon:yes gene_type:complete